MTVARRRSSDSGPLLPPGFTAQPARRFHDPSSGVGYEFVRVYRPTCRLPGRAAIEGQPLDERMSYWWATAVADDRSVTAPSSGGRQITFAEARLTRPRLTFARFSSIEEMRQELPDLLELRSEKLLARVRRATTTIDLSPSPVPSARSR